MRRLTARWIVGTVLVAAICGACVAAGFWQLRRLDERRAVNAQIRSRSAQTVPLPAAGDPEDLIYRRVVVRGTYDVDGEVLVRFRTRTGLPGYEVVTPMTTDEGRLLVDRGWVPLEDGARWPVATMAAPSGQVEVSGLLAPAEGGGTRRERRSSGVEVIAAIDPAKLGDDLYPAYLLADDAGSDASVFPAPVDPPSLSEGPHRSYAVQWFLFASVGLVGWPIMLRRVLRGSRAGSSSAGSAAGASSSAAEPSSS